MSRPDKEAYLNRHEGQRRRKLGFPSDGLKTEDEIVEYFNKCKEMIDTILVKQNIKDQKFRSYIDKLSYKLYNDCKQYGIDEAGLINEDLMIEPFKKALIDATHEYYSKQVTESKKVDAEQFVKDIDDMKKLDIWDGKDNTYKSAKQKLNGIRKISKKVTEGVTLKAIKQVVPFLYDELLPKLEKAVNNGASDEELIKEVQSVYADWTEENAKDIINDYKTNYLNKEDKKKKTSDEIYQEAQNTNVKDWYMSEYPDDTLGEEINSNITFYDVFEAMDNYEDIYDILGVDDSVVRERVFFKLDEILDNGSGYTYEQWLNTARNKRHNKYKTESKKTIESLNASTSKELDVENLKNIKDCLQSSGIKNPRTLDLMSKDVLNLLKSNYDKSTNQDGIYYNVVIMDAIQKKIEQITGKKPGLTFSKTENKKITESDDKYIQNIKDNLESLNVSSFEELDEEIDRLLDEEVIDDDQYDDFKTIIDDLSDECLLYITRRSEATNTDYEDELAIEEDYVQTAINKMIETLGKTESKKVTESEEVWVVRNNKLKKYVSDKENDRWTYVTDKNKAKKFNSYEDVYDFIEKENKFGNNGASNWEEEQLTKSKVTEAYEDEEWSEDDLWEIEEYGTNTDFSFYLRGKTDYAIEAMADINAEDDPLLTDDEIYEIQDILEKCNSEYCDVEFPVGPFTCEDDKKVKIYTCNEKGQNKKLIAKVDVEGLEYYDVNESKKITEVRKNPLVKVESNCFKKESLFTAPQKVIDDSKEKGLYSEKKENNLEEDKSKFDRKTNIKDKPEDIMADIERIGNEIDKDREGFKNYIKPKKTKRISKKEEDTEIPRLTPEQEKEIEDQYWEDNKNDTTFHNEDGTEKSVLDYLTNRIGQQISVGEFNTILQSIFGRFNEVFLLTSDLYNMDFTESQDLVVFDDDDMYTITYDIIDLEDSIIEITDVNVE